MPHSVDPFRATGRCATGNSPLKMLASALPPSPLPHFWVMSGNGAQTDMVQAQAFVDLVKQYQPAAPFLVVKGGQHNYVAWREAFPKMFEWATSQI